MYNFKKIDNENLLETFPLITQLRTDISEKDCVSLFKVMQSEGYQMIALTDHRVIKAIAGFKIQTNFYKKKHLFLYDLVTESSDRSKGYGNAMMTYLEEIALKNQCVYIALESGLARLDAHRFYEDKNNFDKFCYSFRKPLNTK